MVGLSAKAHLCYCEMDGNEDSGRTLTPNNAGKVGHGVGGMSSGTVFCACHFAQVRNA